MPLSIVVGTPDADTSSHTGAKGTGQRDAVAAAVSPGVPVALWRRGVHSAKGRPPFRHQEHHGEASQHRPVPSKPPSQSLLALHCIAAASHRADVVVVRLAQRPRGGEGGAETAERRGQAAEEEIREGCGGRIPSAFPMTLNALSVYTPASISRRCIDASP